MQNQHTAPTRAKQDAPNLRTSTDNIRRERARQKFRFLTAVTFKLSSDSGSKMCEDHKVLHHLAANIANEIANSRHNSSVAHVRTFAHCKYHKG